MQKFLQLICFVLPTLLQSQSYTLNVINGYGSGEFNAGDTVDIWSTAFYGDQFFDQWSGDTFLLHDPLDWHTRLIMPDQNVTVEALIGELPEECTYIQTEIRGADTLKKVWGGWPGTADLKALVWLFHGTNGSGENWFINNDMTLLVKKLMSLGYAVVSLDCEEKTLGQDLNGDGVYRWDYTFDSLQNIDVRNIKAIRDTLIRRGWMDANTIQIGYGYSAGGAFATHIATQLQWRAGLAHNSAGVPWVAANGLTPILYSMTQFDDHPEVGAEAAIRAEAYTDTLLSRGICSVYRYAFAQPLYPERFNRDGGVSLEMSTSLYQELKTNGALDDKDYLLFKSAELIPIILANTDDWPVFLSLAPDKRIFVADEIDETYATHRFNSDLAGSDLRFILSLCSSTTQVETVARNHIALYPNPAFDQMTIPNQGKRYTVYDQKGTMVYAGTSGQLDITDWKPGTYFLVLEHQFGRFVKI